MFIIVENKPEVIAAVAAGLVREGVLFEGFAVNDVDYKFVFSGGF